MKAEIEFTVDRDCKPIIKIRHHDKSDSMEQILLGKFIRDAKENGLIVTNPSGMVSTDGRSHENYTIRPL